MVTPDIHRRKIAAIVLAAGGARRFGKAKQLLEYDGETLVDRACRVAAEAGFDPVVRVLGGHADEILARGGGGAVLTLTHPDWESGVGSSLAYGVAELLEREPDCEAILVMLCDQPTVCPNHLRDIITVAESPGVSIVLSESGACTGPPVLFKSRHFDELLALDGDRGAKIVASRHPEAVAMVAFPQGRWDIDSPESWARFKAFMAP